MSLIRASWKTYLKFKTTEGIMPQAQRKGVIQNTKGKSLVTPAGKSLWVKVDKPDYEYDPKGKYEANLVLDPEDDQAAKFIAAMEKLRDVAVAEAKEGLKPNKAESLKVRPVFHDHDDGDSVIIKTKSYAVDFDGNAQTVPVFSAKGIQLEKAPLIGNGSTIKIQVWASPYHMASDNSVGISFKLKKLQIIKLEEFAGDDGFADESGSGFEDSSEGTVNTDDDF
jgi:hypothetical protein